MSKRVRSAWGPVSDWQRIGYGLGLVVLFVVVVRYGRGPAGDWLGFAGSGVVILGFSVALGWIGLVRVGRASALELGLSGRRPGLEIGLGVAAGVGLTGLLIGYVAVTRGSGAAREVIETMAGFSAADRLLFVGIGLTAAIGEEPLFRGYLQPAAMRVFGTAAGVLAVAVVFALSHPSSWTSLQRLVGLVMIGSVFGVLRGQRRPLTAAAAAHVTLWAVMGTA